MKTHKMHALSSYNKVVRPKQRPLYSHAAIKRQDSSAITQRHANREPPDLSRAALLGHQLRSCAPWNRNVVQRDDSVDNTALRVQQGPSCWLTVIESMLSYDTKDTSTLKVILSMYESSSEINQWKKDNPEKVKDMLGYTAPITKNLVNVKAALVKLNNALIPAQRAGRDVRKEKISKNRLTTLLGRVSASTANAVDEITFDDNDEVTIVQVGRVLKEARVKLKEILKRMKNQDWDKQVTSLFNLGEMSIDKNTDWSDFLLTMKHGVKLPTWIGISEGIKGVNLPRMDTDFRGANPKFESNNHAIMMIAYGTDGTGKFIKYKNPNRGDYVYTVSYAQFLKMAGSGRINIFSFKLGYGGVGNLVD